MSEHNHTPFETLVLDTMRTLTTVVKGIDTRVSDLEARVSPVNDGTLRQHVRRGPDLLELLNLVRAVKAFYYRNDEGQWYLGHSITNSKAWWQSRNDAVDFLFDYVQNWEDSHA